MANTKPLAEQIVFASGGTGAVVRTAQDKIRELVSFEDFGAVGDGLVDDGPALKLAIQFAASNGRSVRGTGGKTYRIASPVEIDTTGPGGYTVDLDGATLSMHGSTARLAFVRGTGSAFLTTSLVTFPVRGGTNIQLSSVAGVEKGDLMELDSPAITSGGVQALQYYVVNDIDGNVVYPDGPFVADMNNQQIADDGKTGSIVVRFYKMTTGGSLKNGTIQSDKTQDTCVKVHTQTHFTAEGLQFRNTHRNGLYVMFCGYDRVINCRFHDYGWVSKDQGYSSVPSAPDQLSFGYGVIHARNYSSLVSGCEGGRGWHMCDVARGQTRIVYSNCIVHKDAYGMSSHEGAWDVKYINCHFYGNAGIGCRSVYLHVDGCTFNQMGSHAIAVGYGQIEIEVRSCKFDMHNASGSAYYFSGDPAGLGNGSLSVGFNRSQVFINNSCEGGIANYAQTSFGRSEYDSVRVENNTLRGSVAKNRGITFGVYGKNIVVSGNTFEIPQYICMMLNVPKGGKATVSHNRVTGDAVVSSGGSRFCRVLAASPFDGTEIVNITHNTCSNHGMVLGVTVDSGAKINTYANNIGFKRIEGPSDAEFCKRHINNVVHGAIAWYGQAPTLDSGTVLFSTP